MKQVAVTNLGREWLLTLDDDDADLFDKHQFRIIKPSPRKDHRYAITNIRPDGVRQTVYLHRMVAERVDGPIPAGVVVDHRNGDGLDNRRCNLRRLTHTQNLHNRRGPNKNSSTGLLGVGFYPKRKSPWRAYIQVTTGGIKKKVCLGYFATQSEACAARAAGEREYWGI